MPINLAFDDFKPVNVTCELRYKNAYLVYDRTGHIIKDVSDAFTNVGVQAATPQQTAFTSDEGYFSVEIGQCRFTSTRFDRNGEIFARHSKTFFASVVRELQIGVFTRIGFRYVGRLEFKTLQESKAALASMSLANLRPPRRFNSSESPTEVMFRWEDDTIGAVIRLKAETAEIKISVPSEMQEHVAPVDKKLIGLILDVDYYTVSSVEREQWDAEEWIVQKLRIIRKEADGILQGGK